MTMEPLRCGRRRRSRQSAKAVVVFALASISLVRGTCAQGLPADFSSPIISSTTKANGDTVNLDAANNIYAFNPSNVGTAPTPVLVTITHPDGTKTQTAITVQKIRGTLYRIDVPGNPPCNYHAATQEGGCPPFVSNNPASAASGLASQMGELRSQTLAVTTIISDRIRSRSREAAQKLARPALARLAQLGEISSIAVPSASGWSAWGDASGSFPENRSSNGYDGTQAVALAGADYQVGTEWIFGFTTGYARTDLSLKNPGSRTTNGAIVGPYGSYIISPNFSVDGQLSYTRLSGKGTTSNFDMSNPPLEIKVSNGFDMNRVTGAVNLNGYKDYGFYKLTGFAGYAYSWESPDTTKLTAGVPFYNIARLGVLRIGGEAGYMLDQSLEAYLPLTYNYETTRPLDGTSRSALVLGAGLRYQLNETINASLVATTTELKDNWRYVFVGANVRWTF